MGRFDGKVVLIAGAKGAAYEIASILCDEGATVIVNDPNSALTDAIEAPVTEKLNYGTSMEETRAMIDELVGSWVTDDATKQTNKESDGKYPALHAVIMNYDEYEVCKMRADQLTLDAYNKAMDINVRSLFHLFGAIREYYRSKQGTKEQASIVVMTSVVGLAGLTQLSTLYAAAKGAVNGLIRCVAKEFGRYANVNGVSQGFYSEKKNLVGPKDRLKGDYQLQMTDRAKDELTYKDVAKMAVYLASDDARMISGQIISVDGGLWLRVQA